MAVTTAPTIESYVDEFAQILKELDKQRNLSLDISPAQRLSELHAAARTILEQRAADRRQLMIEARMRRK